MAGTLNTYARGFRDLVMTLHPQWEAFVYPYTKWTGPADPQDEFYLWFPSNHGVPGIELASWRQRVRCSWGGVSPRPQGHDEVAIRSAVAFVEGVLDGQYERLVIEPWHFVFTKTPRLAIVNVRESGRLPRGKIVDRARWGQSE